MAAGLDWDTVLTTGTLPPWTWKATQAFAEFCNLACEHMIMLVTKVIKQRANAVSKLVAETRVVVATMDAYCKYKAGALVGEARGVLDQLRNKVALLDESQAYHIDQAVAALGGLGAFNTVVCSGDWHQRLEDFNTNPALTRVPWGSADHHDGALGEVDPTAGMDDEEQYGDTAGTGWETPRKKTPNAKRRSFQEPLGHVPHA